MPDDQEKKQDQASDSLALAIERKDYDFLIFYYSYLAPDQSEVDKILQNNPQREFAKPLNSQRNRVLKMALLTKKEMGEKFEILVGQTNRTDDEYFCNAIACCHFYGIATQKNEKRAIIRWEKILGKRDSVNLDLYKANLDYCEEHNLGFKKEKGEDDPQEKVDWIMGEAKNGCAFSQYLLSQHLLSQYTNHPTTDRYFKDRHLINRRNAVMHYLSESAKQEYSNAQYSLSRIYRNGEMGIEVDLKKAYEYCLLAANNEHLQSLVALGIDYQNGISGVIEKDINQSFFWLKKAANLGSPRAQFLVYKLAENDGFQIIPKKEALEWLAKSAKQKYPNALIASTGVTLGKQMAKLIGRGDPDEQMPSEVIGPEEQMLSEVDFDEIYTQQNPHQTMFENSVNQYNDFIALVKADYNFGFLVFCHICIVPNEKELEKIAPYAQLEKNQIEKFLDSNKEFKQAKTFTQILGLIKKLSQSKEDKDGVSSNIIANFIHYNFLKIPDATAKTYYEKAAEKGIGNARFMLAKIINSELKGETSQDKAIAEMTKLAKKGHMPAMYFLALNLYELCLLDENLNNTFGKQAFYWANKLASEVGYEKTVHKLILSNFYFNGVGTKKSNERGMQILEELEKEGAISEVVLEKKKKELEEEKEKELQHQQKKLKRKEKKAKKGTENQKERTEEEKEILEEQKVDAEKIQKHQEGILKKKAADEAKKLEKRQARLDKKAAAAEAEAQKLKQQQEDEARLEKEGLEKEKVRLEKEQELAHSKLQCKTPEASHRLNQSLAEIHQLLHKSGIFDELSQPFQIKLKGSFLYQFYLIAYDCESLKPKDIDLEIITDLSEIDQSFNDKIREIFGLDKSSYKAEEWRGRYGNGSLENIVFKPTDKSLSNSSKLNAEDLPLEVIIRDPKYIDSKLDWVCNFDRLRVSFDKQGFKLQSIGEPLVSIGELIGNISFQRPVININAKPLEKRLKLHFDNGVITQEDLGLFLNCNKANPKAYQVINYVNGLQPSTVCEPKTASALNVPQKPRDICELKTAIALGHRQRNDLNPKQMLRF